MGRGSSKAGGGSNSGKYSSVDDFEKSLTGFDDPRYEDFANAYSTESNYNEGLRNNLNRAINDDGYSAVESTISNEEKMTRSDLSKMPKSKTPAQLGEDAALRERLDILDELKRRKGEKGKSRDVDIVTERRR